MTTALPRVYRLSFGDWLKFPDDGRLYEIVEGELFVTPPPSIKHQRVSREIEFRLLQHLRKHGTGEVLDAPVGVRLSDEDVLEPDLVVVLSEHADRIGEQVIDGPPDLVVEVLSPGTAGRDLGPKRRKYEAAGVPEYWIVDPENESIEVLVLGEAGYARRGPFGRSDRIESRVLPGLELPVDEVFPR